MDPTHARFRRSLRAVRERHRRRDRATHRNAPHPPCDLRDDARRLPGRPQPARCGFRCRFAADHRADACGASRARKPLRPSRTHEGSRGRRKVNSSPPASSDFTHRNGTCLAGIEPAERSRQICSPGRPVPDRRDRMTHTFKLERLDGRPADPPTFPTVAPPVGTRRHDPTRREPDASGRSRSRRRRWPAPRPGRSGPGLRASSVER
jgi:hypothetical protein